MLVVDLKNQIVNNQLDNFYVFSGVEEGIMGVYVAQICKRTNMVRKVSDSVDEVYKDITSKSLLNQACVHVIREDSAFLKDEKAWDTFKAQIRNGIVILIYPNLDKKIKFYKFFENDVIQFEPMAAEVLKAYIQQKIKLNEDWCLELIKNCNSSYSRIMSEVDKIDCISKALNTDADCAYRRLMFDNAIHVEKTFDVFKYVDAIMSRDYDEAFDKLNFVKEQKIEILLTSLLYTNFRSLMIYLNDGGGQGVCDRTGLSMWQIKGCGLSSKHYKALEAEVITEFLHKCEMGLKTGSVPTDNFVEYLLVNIL